MIVPTGLEPAAGRVVGRRQRRSRARPDRLADRRAPEADRGRRRRRRRSRSTRSRRRRSARTRRSPSLELALEQNYLVGNCDNGYSCVYMNTISWRTPTTPLPMESIRASSSSGCSATAARPEQRLAQVARGPQHPRLGDGSGGRRCSGGSAPSDRATVDRVPRLGARDRAADPAGRGAERRVADRAAGSADRHARARTTSTRS